jgi:hypothetical protein
MEVCSNEGGPKDVRFFDRHSLEALIREVALDFELEDVQVV